MTNTITDFSSIAEMDIVQVAAAIVDNEQFGEREWESLFGALSTTSRRGL